MPDVASPADNTAAAQPSAPPAWNDVLAAAKAANLPLDAQRTALQTWTAKTRAFLDSPAAGDLNPEQRRQVLDYAQEQYDAVTPGVMSNIGSGIKSLPGALLGTAAGAISIAKPNPALAPIRRGFISRGLADADNLSNLGSNLPGGPGGDLDNLKKEFQDNIKGGMVIHGGKLNTPYLNGWAKEVLNTAADYNNDDAKDYNSPQRQISDPTNQALINHYYATLDPTTLDQLWSRLTQSKLSERADADVKIATASLPGATPDYIKNTFGAGLDPLNAAMMAIPGLGESELPAWAAKLGLAAKVAQKVAPGIAAGGGLGAVGALAQNPQASLGEVAKNAEVTAGMGGVMGGVTHGAVEAFNRIKDAVAKPTSTEVSPPSPSPIPAPSSEAPTTQVPTSTPEPLPAPISNAAINPEVGVEWTQPLTREPSGANVPPPPETQPLSTNESTPNSPLPARPPSPLESAATDLRASTDATARSNGHDTPTESDQHDALRSFADAKNLNGRIVPPEETQFSGGEHEVWYDQQSNRYFKATHPGSFGVAASGIGQPTPADYLERLGLANQFFGDDVRVESVNGTGKDTQIITSQPNVVGKPAKIADIDAYMAQRDFQKIPGAPYTYTFLDGNGDHIVVGDAKPKNVITTPNGTTVPIDVQIEKLSPEEMAKRFPKSPSLEKLQPTPSNAPQIHPLKQPSAAAPSPDVGLTRTAPREAVSENSEQVGGSQGQSANGGNSPARSEPIQQAVVNPELTSAIKEELRARASTPSDVLYHEPAVKVTTPDGERFVRVTFENPKLNPKVYPVDEVNKGILAGERVSDIEAGNISGKKFVPADGEVKVEPAAPKKGGPIPRRTPYGRPGFVMGIDELAKHIVDAGIYLYGKVKDFGQWSAQMIKTYGGHIKDSLVGLWDKATHSSPQARAESRVGYLMRGTLDKIGEMRDAATNALRSRPERDTIAAGRDAVKNAAHDVGEQSANDIRGQLRRVFPEFYKGVKALSYTDVAGFLKKAIPPEDALSAVVEARGDKGQIDVMRAKVNGPESQADPYWKKRINTALDFAEKNWDTLQPIADDYNAHTDLQVAQENAQGIDTGKIPGYVMHAQDVDGPKGFETLMRGGGDGNTRFKLERAYPTFADSITAGVDPHTLNSVDLLKGRVKGGQLRINEGMWVDSLKDLKDPTNKQPILSELVNQPRQDGTFDKLPPQGYQAIDVGGRRIAVQQGYAPLLNALTQPSRIVDSGIGLTIKQLASLGKTGLTLADTMHLGYSAMKSAINRASSLEDFRNPLDATSYKRGGILADYSTAEIKRMVGAGELPKDALANLEERKRVYDGVLRNGLNGGRVTDNIYNQITHNLPVIGSLNKFTFESYIRGAIHEMAQIEYGRQKAMNPNLSDEQIFRNVAKGVNTWFSNLGDQGVLKGKTYQDLSRMLMLAPQFLEARLRTEGGAVAEGLRAIPNSIKAGRLSTGPLFRGAVTSLVGAFTLAQLINLYTRGKPTWENPEEGVRAKVSAWIPDELGRGPGLFLDPLSLTAPIAAQAYANYSKNGGDATAAVSQLMRGKASFFARPLINQATNTDSFNRPIPPGGRLAQLGSDLIPAPILSQPLAKFGKQVVTGQPNESFPGQFQRQILSSVGVRAENAPDQGQRIYGLAQKFNTDHNIKPEATFNTSDYQSLTAAVRIGNPADIKVALDKLLTSKTPEQIIQHYTSSPLFPFTGSASREREFVNSLTPEQKSAYQQALIDRKQTGQQALNALASQPDATPDIIAAAKNYPLTMQAVEQQHAEATHKAELSTQAKSIYNALAAQKDGSNDARIMAPLSGNPELYQAFNSYAAAQQKAREEAEYAPLVKKIGSLSTADGSMARITIKILGQLPPEEQDKFIAAMKASGHLTPKLVQQINQLSAQ